MESVAHRSEVTFWDHRAHRRQGQDWKPGCPAAQARTLGHDLASTLPSFEPSPRPSSDERQELVPWTCLRPLRHDLALPGHTALTAPLP